MAETTELTGEQPLLDALAQARPAHAQEPGLARAIDLRLVQRAITGGAPPTLGRFELEARLGEGGLGVVYRARDPVLDRPVAVKLLRERGALRRGLEREARALARLDHPNVVRVFDLGEQDEQAFVAMELVPGGTLASRLARGDASWGDGLRWITDVTRGLLAAHRAGLVHCDVKPANVLIASDGRACVTDFGLARELDDGSAAAASMSGSLARGRRSGVGGTPGFIAPELHAGARPTAASDQFALGVTLGIVLRAIEGWPVAVRASLLDIAMRATREAAERRFSGLDELLVRLEALARAGAPARGRALLLERVERVWLRSHALGSGVTLTVSSGDDSGSDAPTADEDGADGAAAAASGTAGSGSRREGGPPERAVVSRPVGLRVEPALERVEHPWPGDGHGWPPPRPSGDPWDSSQLAALLRESLDALLVIGSAGSGKTTALLQASAELARAAWQDANARAPVVLNLATFGRGTNAPHPSFAAWIEDEVVTKYGMPRAEVRGLIEQRELVLLLDGLDEVPVAARRRCLAAIEAERAERATPVIVTCREAALEGLGARPRFGGAVRIPEVSPEAARALVDQLAGDRVAPEVLRTLAETVNTPLDAALAVTVARRGGGTAWGDAPDPAVVREELHARYVEVALRGSPPLASDERERRREQLQWLARAMTRLGRSDVWLEELGPEWLETAGARAGARVLGWVLTVAVAALVVFGAAWLAWPLDSRRRPPELALISLFVAVLALGLAGRRRFEAVEFDRARMIRHMAWPTVGGALLACAVGAILNVPGHSTWLADGAMGAIAGAVASPLAGVRPTSRARKLRPEATARRALQHAARMGVIVGLTAMVVVGVLAPLVGLLAAPPPDGVIDLARVRWTHGVRGGLNWALGAGPPLAVLTFLYVGGAAWLSQLATRIVARWTSPMSLRWVPELDDAAARGVLRRVGAGWMFRHDNLRALLQKGDGFGSGIAGPAPAAIDVEPRM